LLPLPHRPRLGSLTPAGYAGPELSGVEVGVCPQCPKPPRWRRPSRPASVAGS